MNPVDIKSALKDYDQAKVDIYINYLKQVETAKNKDGALKNPWFKYKADAELVSFYKKVALDGLNIDGEHITLSSRGISYDYFAYRNLMYLRYPETTWDFGIVFKDDTFKFQKQSGKVIYTHDINNPFNQDENNIIGAYVVITNKRGQFLTLLSKENIDKCRKVAKTDNIWNQWYLDMALKTVIRKAVKIHFADMYQNVETLDNENSDLELPLDVDIKDKGNIEQITTLEELKKYYNENKGRNAGILQGFNKLVSIRKAEIEEINSKETKKDPEQNKDDSIREPGEDDE